MNKAMLIGRLAADPEKRTTTSGKNVCFFPIAINRDWKSSDGQKSQTTDYHRVVSWQGLADVCAKNLRKGMGVYIEGRLMNRSFNGKEGEKKYMTEIVLENLNILDWLNDKPGEKDVVLKEMVED